jgi:phospholipase/carboxylesterase
LFEIISSRKLASPLNMNRTKASQIPSSKSLIPPELNFAAALATTSTTDVPHTLFAPLHYESGYAYPLIVWLHGQAQDERHLLRIMPLVSMRNYVAVAPRGTSLPAAGKAALGWHQTVEHVLEAEQRIFHCVQIARKKLHVAAHRVFLAGFDCGGTMAFRLAMNHPQLFAGALSLGGAFPAGDTPFRHLADARRVPLFLAVGRDSTQYGSEAVCRDLRLLHSAGMSITLRQYPCGHELAPQMLTDVDRWIIEQITSPAYQQAESVID